MGLVLVEQSGIFAQKPVDDAPAVSLQLCDQCIVAYHKARASFLDSLIPDDVAREV